MEDNLVFDRSKFIELEFTSEKDFKTTKHLFTHEHYRLAIQICSIPFNVNGKVMVHPNKKDLIVCFDYGSEITADRVQRELGVGKHRVIIQCPEHSTKFISEDDKG